MDQIEQGKILKAYREREGLTQMKVGEIMDISYQQIQKYEKGTSSLSVKRIPAYAKALGLAPSVLALALLGDDAHKAPAHRQFAIAAMISSSNGVDAGRIAKMVQEVFKDNDTLRVSDLDVNEVAT
jgi:transcriptional regulator with XRE-family HTH domain